jgi:hypothetical protein
MPIHDWTRMEAGDFHHFHQGWITNLANALNAGGLPSGYTAMVDRVFSSSHPDAVAGSNEPPVGVSRQETPPPGRYVARYDMGAYAQRADQVVVRHTEHGDVAVVAVVSPGHKAGRIWLRTFVHRVTDLLSQGIHLLIVDLLPPTPRDPKGIHKAIWDEFDDLPFDAPAGKPLTLAAYVGAEMPTAYVDFIGVGDPLPEMPIFLSEDRYVMAPLEETYNQAWAAYPATLKAQMERPAD